MTVSAQNSTTTRALAVIFSIRRLWRQRAAGRMLRVTDITPVPGATDYVLGIINLRGHIVTVTTRADCSTCRRGNRTMPRIVIIEINRPPASWWTP